MSNCPRCFNLPHAKYFWFYYTYFYTIWSLLASNINSDCVSCFKFYSQSSFICSLSVISSYPLLLQLDDMAILFRTVSWNLMDSVHLSVYGYAQILSVLCFDLHHECWKDSISFVMASDYLCAGTLIAFNHTLRPTPGHQPTGFLFCWPPCYTGTL